jgi:hypothetical protein
MSSRVINVLFFGEWVEPDYYELFDDGSLWYDHCGVEALLMSFEENVLWKWVSAEGRV